MLWLSFEAVAADAVQQAARSLLYVTCHDSKGMIGFTEAEPAKQSAHEPSALLAISRQTQRTQHMAAKQIKPSTA